MYCEVSLAIYKLGHPFIAQVLILVMTGTKKEWMEVNQLPKG